MAEDGANRPARSAAGDALTDLVLPVFELNGEFLAAAKDIAEPAGLTPAWWQVLGATLDEPLPVAEIARRVGLGLARQSVQRTADLLVEQGWATYRDNPHHRRAKLLAADPGRARHPAAVARGAARLGRCRRRRSRCGRAGCRVGHGEPGDPRLPTRAGATLRWPHSATSVGVMLRSARPARGHTHPAVRPDPAARRRSPPGARWATRDRGRPRPRPGPPSRRRSP